MTSPADTLRQAADLIAAEPRRKGSLVEIGNPNDVLISGDIHGRSDNLGVLLKLLESRPEMTLILQEIIHGPIDPTTGTDRSAELLVRAARAKIEHPERVHFLLANHDVAQITGSEITKNGRGVCHDFMLGLTHSFGDEAPDVYVSMMAFLRCLPLAIRFDNGLLTAHSLPSPHRAHLGPAEILDRSFDVDDLQRGGAAYEWTWGRDQTDEQIDALADELDVSYFVLGHRHIDEGYLDITPHAIAINTDGAHGRIFRFNAQHPVTSTHAHDHLQRIDQLEA